MTLFNCKTQQLNKSDKTVIGKFVGKGKSNVTIELTLSENNKFKFWAKVNSLSFDFTEGIWEKRNDTLILNSKVLNDNEGLNYALSSANWIEFKNSKWKMKSTELIRIPDKKWKMKKIAE